LAGTTAARQCHGYVAVPALRTQLGDPRPLYGCGQVLELFFSEAELAGRLLRSLPAWLGWNEGLPW
jgi:hypothetical protein